VQPNWRGRFDLAKLVGYKQDMIFFKEKKEEEEASFFIHWLYLLE
jgi:hypothetical protein